MSTVRLSAKTARLILDRMLTTGAPMSLCSQMERALRPSPKKREATKLRRQRRVGDVPPEPRATALCANEAHALAERARGLERERDHWRAVAREARDEQTAWLKSHDVECLDARVGMGQRIADLEAERDRYRDLLANLVTRLDTQIDGRLSILARTALKNAREALAPATGPKGGDHV